MIAIQMDYSLNYTIKMLNHIADYYKISKRKLKKDELIEKIIEFEGDYDNILVVEERKKLWIYMRELKDDPYMSQFVCGFDGV